MSGTLLNQISYRWLMRNSIQILTCRTIRHHEIIPKPKKRINPNPVLVRPESELKSIVQLDTSSPVLIHRLEEIRNSPVGWLDRMVPSPRLPYDVKRNYRNRFDIVTEMKYHGRKKDWYTILDNIEGDLEALMTVIEWRLSYLQKKIVIRKLTYKSIEVRGFHRVIIATLLQGMGF